MIYTSYFAQLRNIPQNVIPISICAQVPKWYTGLQYKKIAPKYDFFMKWKENHDNDYYIECFNEQVLKPLVATDVVSELHRLIPLEIKEKMQAPIWTNTDYHIALLCYEKPTDFCHRHLVAEWLRQNGIDCKEWEKTS